jgi:hypothetical protein
VSVCAKAGGPNVGRRNLKQRELKISLAGVVHHESTSRKLVEKGIDLRLGLDLVKHTRLKIFDLAIIFSQDGDLAEAVDDAYEIAKEQQAEFLAVVVWSHQTVDLGYRRDLVFFVENVAPVELRLKAIVVLDVDFVGGNELPCSGSEDGANRGRKMTLVNRAYTLECEPSKSEDTPSHPSTVRRFAPFYGQAAD